MNTQEQKADELIEEFKSQFYGYNINEDDRLKEATKCAIICAEKLRNQHDKIVPSSIDINGQINHNWKYWDEVLSHLKSNP